MNHNLTENGSTSDLLAGAPTTGAGRPWPPTFLQITPVKDSSLFFAVVIFWHWSLAPHFFWSLRRPCQLCDEYCSLLDQVSISIPCH